MRNKKGIFFILVGAVVIVLASMLLPIPPLTTAPAVYRPVFGSLGCVLSGDVEEHEYNLNSEGVGEFICMGPECRITELSGAKCDIIEIRQVNAKVGSKTANRISDIYSSRMSGSQGQRYQINVRCFNPIYQAACSVITTPLGGPILFSDFCWKVSHPPAKGTYTAQWKETQLVKFQDGSRFFASPNCYVDDVQIENVKERDKEKISIWLQKGLEILGIRIGEYLGGEKGRVESDVEGRLYIPLGRYIPYIVKWERLEGPSLHIYKPKVGKFKNKNIICDTTDNKVYELGEVSTTTGRRYTIPVQELGSVECCTDADCWGSGKVCSISDGSFECKESGRKECYSDIQCEGSAGEDNRGKYIIEGYCDRGECRYEKRYIQCIRNSDCPSRSGYIAGCDKNYRCTYIKEPKKECKKDIDCDDRNPNTEDRCIGSECKYTYIQERVSQTCGEECRVIIFGQALTNPVCYIGCVVSRIINAIFSFMWFSVKLMISVIFFMIGNLLFLHFSKRRRGRSKLRYILALIWGCVIGYIVWIML